MNQPFNTVVQKVHIRGQRGMRFKKEYTAFFKDFFKDNVRYQTWTCRGPISLILGTRIRPLKHLKNPAVPTIKHSSSKMICGAMYKNGTAGLYFLPVGMTMNGLRYFDLLREKLQRILAVYQATVLMHDVAPCHRCKMVKS